MPFWTAFCQLGGVEALGYPISRRFTLDGFVSQATQRTILQWHPSSGSVAFVNVLDRLHDAGYDPWLAAFHSTPPQLDASTFDAGKTATQAAQDRLALLEAAPAIQAAYNSAANPVQRFGLPTSPVTDMGNHVAVRLQRTVIQQWKENVPWARAGSVTFANAGVIALEAGLLPPSALVPEPLPTTTASEQALVTAAAAVRPATVAVLAAPVGSGTGFIFNVEGHVLTADHVVAGARAIHVGLPDGRLLEAELVGRDPWLDVAVLKVSAEGLPVAQVGDSSLLRPDDPVVALGYGTPNPEVLSVRYGRVVDQGQGRYPGSSVSEAFYILSETNLVPGFSGGPLINAEGQVIGLNTAIVTSRRFGGESYDYSIAINSALEAARQLMAEGTTSRVWLGVGVVELNPEVAAAYALTVEEGILILRVERNSPAADAGLRPGDTVVAVEGKRVTSVADLAAGLRGKKMGDEVRLTVVDSGGQERNATLILATLP